MEHDIEHAEAEAEGESTWAADAELGERAVDAIRSGELKGSKLGAYAVTIAFYPSVSIQPIGYPGQIKASPAQLINEASRHLEIVREKVKEGIARAYKHAEKIVAENAKRIESTYQAVKTTVANKANEVKTVVGEKVKAFGNSAKQTISKAISTLSRWFGGKKKK